MPLPGLEPPKRGAPPTHPGELLKEIVLPALKAAGTSRAEVADLIGMDRTSFYKLLAAERPVTAELALKLGKLCGNGPDLWLNMQKAWDLEQARASLGDALAAIPTLKVA
ncbi:MAG: HigA family addiction module antitoxin [Pseudomonadota bacterium]